MRFGHHRQGTVKRSFIRPAASRNADNVSAAEYISKLKQRLDLHAPNDRIVFIVAEDELNYAKLIAAIDGAKQAGAEILGFATDPPDPAMFPTGG